MFRLGALGRSSMRTAFAALLVAHSLTATAAEGLRWEPEFRFPGTFFPAFAIASAGRDSKGPSESPTASGYLGSGSFSVKILEAPAGAKIKVVVEIPELAASGDIEATADGRPRALVPRLSWNQAKLATIAQPISSEVVFRVYVDGSLAGEEKRPLRIRASNDSPLRVCKAPEQCSDYSPYLAAFVNENHPGIDAILREDRASIVAATHRPLAHSHPPTGEHGRKKRVGGRQTTLFPAQRAARLVTNETGLLVIHLRSPSAFRG